MPAGSDAVAAHFPYGGEAAGAARRLVSATLVAWDRSDLDEIATLLVSELIANVVLHAGTGLDLHLRRAGDRVRSEVHDANPRLPDRKYYSATSTTGRGLLLVEELSRAWGAEPTATGKAVWFELDEAAPGAGPGPAVGAYLDLDDWGDDLDDWGDVMEELPAPQRRSSEEVRRSTDPAPGDGGQEPDAPQESPGATSPQPQVPRSMRATDVAACRQARHRRAPRVADGG